MAYFKDEKDQSMLAEFWEFDRKMIHEKYRSVVEELEKDGRDVNRGMQAVFYRVLAPIGEIFALNLKDQKLDVMDTKLHNISFSGSQKAAPAELYALRDIFG